MAEIRMCEGGWESEQVGQGPGRMEFQGRVGASLRSCSAPEVLSVWRVILLVSGRQGSAEGQAHGKPRKHSPN